MKTPLLALLIFSTALLSAQSWIQVDNLPAGVHHPVTWTLNGIGYASTGTNNNDAPTDKVYRYDPQTDNWTTLSNFPGSARSFAIGVAYQGVGYLGFGATQFAYLDDLWKYVDSTGTWTQLASCPCAGRRHPSFVAVNGAIYVGLGEGAAGNLKDWWKYDIASDSWSSIPDLPGQGRHHPFQFTVNGNVYAGMGHAGNTIFDDWYELNTSTDTWTKMSDFPGEARVAGTQLDHNGKGYVLSGDGDNHSAMPTGEFWEYEHSTDSWTQLTPHPGRSRWAPGSFVINDEVYIVGGLDRLASTLRTEVYKFALSGGVGVENEAINRLSVFPNPAQTTVSVAYNAPFDEVKLFNSVGQPVIQGKPQDKLNVAALPPGVYQIMVFEEGQLQAQQKLLIK